VTDRTKKSELDVLTSKYNTWWQTEQNAI